MSKVYIPQYQVNDKRERERERKRFFYLSLTNSLLNHNDVLLKINSSNKALNIKINAVKRFILNLTIT